MRCGYPSAEKRGTQHNVERGDDRPRPHARFWRAPVRERGRSRDLARARGQLAAAGSLRHVRRSADEPGARRALHAAEPLAVLEGRARHPRDRRSPSGASSTSCSGASSRGRASSVSRASSTARRTCSREGAPGSGSFWFRLGLIFVTIVTVIWLFQGGTWVEALQSIFHGIGHIFKSPAAVDPDRLRLLPLHRQLRDPDGPSAAHEPRADARVRAGRRGVGCQARRRPRPGRGEGRGAARRHDLAVGRGLRARRRQARARPALPRCPGNGQDDARQGPRDRLQLTVRLDARVGLRRDVHRHRRDRRARARAAREEARAQVGRSVHRLHRRDRRRRHAPPGHRSR